MTAVPARRDAHRRRMWGGVVGPVCFIAAWVVSGAATTGYSPIDDAISELAAIGAPTRALMTLGFLLFAAGVWVFATPVDAALPGGAGPALRLAAVATAGAAVFPLGGAPWDTIHGGFAGLGYIALAATPVVAALRLVQRGSGGAALVSAATGMVGATCLVVSLISADNGLWQRLGLTILDLWIVGLAAILLSGASARSA